MEKFVKRGVAKITKSDPVQVETFHSLDTELTTAQNSIIAVLAVETMKLL